MAPLNQTIAVIDKSGKIVSTSKHLFGVFQEAKNAYSERKAHVRSQRNAKLAEAQALKALQNYRIDDTPSVASSHRTRRSNHQHQSQAHRRSGYEQDLHRSVSQTRSTYPARRDMVRRHTHHELVAHEADPRPMPSRSKSEAHVDMDLAYGEYYPPARVAKFEDPELNGLVGRAQWLLEEANCVHHSATKTIAHLQKNPDAMAAVALTLAEISNLVRKMAPTALVALRNAAPAVFSLLISPQFLIAAGVGLGVTIVMFGGYKIIKQIRASNSDAEPHGAGGVVEDDSGMDEMMEINTEHLSRVEMWRRGVADAGAVSAGTSIDGEFISPAAAAMSGIDVAKARSRRDPRFKFDDDVSRTTSRRSRRSHASKVGTRVSARAASTVGSGTPTTAPSVAPAKSPFKFFSKKGSRNVDKNAKPKEKVKRSSRLRLMFTA